MKLLAVAACLLIAACGKDDKAAGDRPAPTPAGAGQCRTLVPASIVAKYFAGYEPSERLVGNSGVQCRFIRTSPFAEVSVSFNCEQAAAAAMTGMIERQKAKGGVELPGLGKGAVKIGHAVMVWDDDSTCVLTIIAADNEIAIDPLPFAKDLTAAVTAPKP